MLFRSTHRLRRHGVAAEQDTASRGFKAQMKSADASHAAWTCIIGPEEMEKGLVTARNSAEDTTATMFRDNSRPSLPATRVATSLPRGVHRVVNPDFLDPVGLNGFRESVFPCERPDAQCQLPEGSISNSSDA